MKLKKLLERASLGVLITEFVIHVYFIFLSTYMGEMIVTLFPSNKGIVFDAMMQVISYGIVGLLLGMIVHSFIEGREKISTARKEFKFAIIHFVWTFIAFATASLLKYTIGGYFPFATLLMRLLVILAAIISILTIEYFILSPILDKFDKKCVDELNRKLKENK